MYNVELIEKKIPQKDWGNEKNWWIKSGIYGFACVRARKKNISHPLPLTSEPALRMEYMCKSNKTCVGKNYDQLIINDFDCIFTCTDHLTYLIKMFSLFSVFVILAAPAPRSCSLMRISVWNGLRFFLMSTHGLQVSFAFNRKGLEDVLRRHKEVRMASPGRHFYDILKKQSSRLSF